MKPLKQNLAAVFACLLAFPSMLPAQDEAAQIAMLNNRDATLAQKQDACRNLARVGTAKSVPVLAGLLGDAELSHMARYALEPIPDPAVDAALRGALGTVKGGPLLGVIGSIGVRGDVLAIPALAGLLREPDPDLARAAARALGEIGSPEAAEVLQPGLKGASPGQFQAVSEGLFRCAESLAAQGSIGPAREIYDLLRGIAEVPHAIRTAALRGAVLTRGTDGLPLLMEALRGDDYATFSSAVRISMELDGPEVTRTLAGELGKLPADRQLLVVQTLAQRGDATSAPALMALLETAEMPVRVAAMQTLARLEYAPVVPQLAKLSLAGDGELAAAAQEGLGGFPGEAADAAITDLLKNADPKARRLGAELIGRRRIDFALPALLHAATTDQDETVCVAALLGLRDLAGPREMGTLLEILLNTESKPVIQAATQALVVVCARPAPAGTIEIRMATYGDVSDSKFADVTKTVADLVKQGKTAIEASNATFGDPSPGLPKKLVVHYSVDGVQASKTVAEQETLSLTPPNAPAAVADPLVAALGKASGPAKLGLLRVLRSAGGPKALVAVLTLVGPGADDPKLANEACAAALDIAERIAGTSPAEVHAAMQKVAAATPDKGLAEQARKLAESTEGKK